MGENEYLFKGRIIEAETLKAGLYDIDGKLLVEITKEQVEATTYSFFNNLPKTLGVDETKVSSIIFPENVTSIGKYAFINCAFTSITIPNLKYTEQ